MDKEYNIDDILSEVKKRREEQEMQLRAEPEQEASEAPKEETVSEPADEAADEPVEEAMEIPDEEPEAEPTEDTVQEEAQETDEAIEELEIEIDKEPEAEEEPEQSEFVDLMAISEDDELEAEEAEYAEPEYEEPAREKKPMSKTKKTIIKIITAIIALILIAGIVAAAVANNMLDRLMKNNDNTAATVESKWTGMDELVENFDPISETEASELSSLNDMIKSWYYNGAPCSSSHVLNVLLVGEDTRGTKILEEGTRADSAIIVSVNIDTQQIVLTSILRDAWAYWEKEKGNSESGQFGKINGAMSTVDINGYINCVESLYKIDIDQYAIVNFDSFEGIVDALGGVTIEMTDAEINEINSKPLRYNRVTIEKQFEGDKGKQKLNGKQALAYCRIRKLDSDNKRADRQKTCLIEIFNQSKDASKVKLIKIVNKLIPYVKTSFNKGEIVKIAKYAITQGWLDYKINMQNLPDYRLKGGTYYKQWVWRPDYPADAYNLQMALYGKSNITLAALRPDTQTCPEDGFYSEGAPVMSQTIANDNYGEVTTFEFTTEKDETESTTVA